MDAARWLKGTWRSDKKRTIAAWGKYSPLSPKARRLLVPMLGKLKIQYGKKRFLTSFRGTAGSEPYRVVWSSPTEVLVVYGAKGRESGRVITFESPSLYWLHTARFREYFSKVRRRTKR